ncbi:hypothetical protein HMPREF1984_02114 [Leptotrichia sp. oral taxon 215 str. W9775]|uniref:hypothetical protein n=1 Tax=Leptotrichia sp. oral taxon 215 TaxID=712359 RepID=UPI0003AE72D4|nr:hypothetical protein [Leptotrichia sp. oral taxon 215]ERK65740.1 hypothetical protein HMPREF1984_02114 [Leptotrichia sp. oral taxon 215 str. W9775]
MSKIIKFIIIISVCIITNIIIFIYTKYSLNLKNEYIIGSSSQEYQSVELPIKAIYINGNSLLVLGNKNLSSSHYIKNIEIIYYKKKIGNIEINKKILELNYYKKENYYLYNISESEINKILDKNNLNNILRNRFFEYDKNYFEFKIFIENKKTNEVTSFVIKNIGIRYKKWYDFEIPYF